MSEEMDVSVENEAESTDNSDADYNAEILAAQGLVEESEDDQSQEAPESEEQGNEADEQARLPENSSDSDDAEKEKSGDEQKEVEGKESEEQAAPPKGHVRLEALHAEKEHRRHVQQENAGLKEQVGQLETRLEELRSQTLASIQTGFKKLSPEQLQQLAYDDPEAIPKYLENEKKYEQALQELSAQKTQPYETEEFQREVDFAYTSLSAQIPGILEQGSEAQTKFYEAFNTAGLDDSFSPLLDPSTVLMTPDGKTIPMGEKVISVINLVNKVGANNPDKIRGEIEKEITEKVTKELVAKFKKPSQSTSSLADLSSVDHDGPGVPEPSPGQKDRFTEGQWDRYTAGADWRNK